MKPFSVDLSPITNKYKIIPSDEVYSYFAGVNFAGRIPCRVLGISFAEYLRMGRDAYGATIMGKTGYPYLVFNERKDAQKLADLLSTYWTKGNKNL